MTLLRPLILALLALAPMAKSAHAADLWGLRYQHSIEPREWEDFAARFVAPNGRLRDTANGDMSHSEGQGYGMLLAFMAGHIGDFERIWHFAHTELQLRDDGLLAWSWEEAAIPHVTDANNASDGDILVAYALILAGSAWERADLYAEGTALMAAIRAHLIIAHPEFGPVLKPGKFGFDGEGLVVNPSYWIDEAFLTFAAIDPAGPWLDLIASGEALLAAARARGFENPPDWVLLPLNGGLREAPEKSSKFGFNALRVPLYQIRAGRMPGPDMIAMVARFEALALPDAEGAPRPLTEPGYGAIAALISCAVGESALSVAANPDFSGQDYYPATLHLLAISTLRAAGAACLSEGI